LIAVRMCYGQIHPVLVNGEDGGALQRGLAVFVVNRPKPPRPRTKKRLEGTKSMGINLFLTLDNFSENHDSPSFPRLYEFGKWRVRRDEGNLSGQKSSPDSDPFGATLKWGKKKKLATFAKVNWSREEFP